MTSDAPTPDPTIDALSAHIQNIYAEIKRLDVSLERFAERFERSAERHQRQHDNDAEATRSGYDTLRDDLSYLSEQVTRLERR